MAAPWGGGTSSKMIVTLASHHTKCAEDASGADGSVTQMEVGLSSQHKPEKNPSRDLPWILARICD